MTEINNAGCRGCRYYLQTSSECLKENRRGELMRKGLAGLCGEFKKIQNYNHATHKEAQEAAFHEQLP